MTASDITAIGIVTEDVMAHWHFDFGILAFPPIKRMLAYLELRLSEAMTLE